MSVDWFVIPFERSDSSRPSLLPDLLSGLQQRGVCPAALRSLSGDRVFFKHNRSFDSVLQGGMVVTLSFPKVCDVSLGTPGALMDLFSSDKGCTTPQRTRYHDVKYARIWATV